MFNEIATTVAINDVKNALFELGILESPEDIVDLEQTLRDGLGLDSQEVISLIEIVSSLIMSGDPLDDDAFDTVCDLVCYLASNRAPWLPGNVPYVIQGSIIIDKDVDTVFGYIYNYKIWPDVLNHVTKIEPEYDDGKFQNFKMHIEELGTKQNYFVESNRYVNKENLIIDFTQPLPPAGFKLHFGGWRFRTIDENRTELISYHGFSLKEGADIEGAFSLIRKHIQAALNTWSRHSLKELCCE
ncbi:SRPBCC family protein [Vibrio cholerae]|uniref:SRPBCC family protein n=1 Tax=Vibrio cholerae TaxID=666 RepID=UPI0028BD11B4|nr:SRPBCC family protein [Vibrio vulnificus]EKF9485871.1 SRPBCC family protein [Vibrio cholerae]ELP3384932.1 SRPBCC family protein [Vibrio cholerae]ELP3388178.1 SRPBCC family protein [Vibrio cholerae]ELR9907537.1 SRPBCC family protein [Vibrio cholerae]